MDEVEVPEEAADRFEAEYAQQLLAEALRRKSETDFEHHVSLCTPPPKVLSPAGGSGLSRVHFLAVFYLQRLTSLPYPRIYAILSPGQMTETVTDATVATGGRAVAAQGLAGATVTHTPYKRCGRRLNHFADSYSSSSSSVNISVSRHMSLNYDVLKNTYLKRHTSLATWPTDAHSPPLSRFICPQETKTPLARI